ncbi:ABC transporter substrate-binding protein [Candidatus Dependentiae bacterium]|nr:ABC transporter substrate-binding protein [Candidatus Dependentiae bacterium]
MKLITIFGLIAGVIALLLLLRWTGYVSFCSPTSTPPSTIMRVGTSADYPPFTFKKDGVIVGFEIDIVKKLAEKIGKKLEIVDLSWEMLLPELKMNNIQAIAACLSKTERRAREVHFLSPHLIDHFVIVTKPSRTDIASVQDLVGKEVVVNDGYTADAYISAIPGINIRRLPTIAEAILALNNDIVTAFVTAYIPMKLVMDKSPTQYRITPIPDTREELCIAVSYDEPALYTQLEQAMQELQASGALTELAHTWGLVA